VFDVAVMIKAYELKQKVKLAAAAKAQKEEEKAAKEAVKAGKPVSAKPKASASPLVNSSKKKSGKAEMRDEGIRQTEAMLFEQLNLLIVNRGSHTDGVWVCGWVCGCVGVWVCGYVCVWVGKWVGVSYIRV
jgi:hypothetical protein